MSDNTMIAVILLGLIATATAILSITLLAQTLSGLGAGGLALTGIPILVLGAISVLSVYGIATLCKRNDPDRGEDSD